MTIHIRTIDAIEGPRLVEPDVFGDARGYFKETFRASLLDGLGVESFLQDNESFSAKGVLRGLHYQLEPHSQAKLVRCLRGAVFDVLVDIRVGSPTFGKWLGYELSAENHRMLFLPKGFAHGFVALQDDTLIQYKQSAYYEPASERSIAWNDPNIGIDWPVTDPLISEKDKLAPKLGEAENNFSWKG